MTGAVRAGNWIATAGALIFVFVLFVSAYAEPDIRWLHFFQSWMYLATIILIWTKNKWGYFVGVGAAAFWDYANVFVTTFLKNGLDQTSIFMLRHLRMSAGLQWTLREKVDGLNTARRGHCRNNRLLRAHYGSMPTSLFSYFPGNLASASSPVMVTGNSDPPGL
jgi:hypothetical protein